MISPVRIELEFKSMTLQGALLGTLQGALQGTLQANGKTSKN